MVKRITYKTIQPGLLFFHKVDDIFENQTAIFTGMNLSLEGYTQPVMFFLSTNQSIWWEFNNIIIILHKLILSLSLYNDWL